MARPEAVDKLEAAITLRKTIMGLALGGWEPREKLAEPLGQAAIGRLATEIVDADRLVPTATLRAT